MPIAKAIFLVTIFVRLLQKLLTKWEELKMESSNFIELAVAIYKDKVQRELIEKFRVESRRLLEADAEARRSKARENILAMAKLKNELFKFKLTYSMICGICGNIEAVDNYLRSVEKKVKLLSYKKNHGLLA